MIEAASSYPLLNVFWTMLLFFGWMLWIWLLITVFMDLFSRSDVSGWGKAGWTVLVLVLPFVGVLIYFGTQSRAMAERRLTEMQTQQESFDSYVRSVAASDGGPAAEINRAKQLLDSGAITAEEFEAIKRRTLTAS